MKCEICKTIARLGLEDSAHDLWYCADAQAKKAQLRHVRTELEQLVRGLGALLLMKWRQRRQACAAHRRQRLVTLGI